MEQFYLISNPWWEGNDFFTGIRRENILNQLLKLNKSKDIVLLTGLRRVGKTTLLNMLAGFERPTSGKILVDGKEVGDIHPSRSMLFQQPALIPWMTVRKNLGAHLLNSGS